MAWAPPTLHGPRAVAPPCCASIPRAMSGGSVSSVGARLARNCTYELKDITTAKATTTDLVTMDELYAAWHTPVVMFMSREALRAHGLGCFTPQARYLDVGSSRLIKPSAGGRTWPRCQLPDSGVSLLRGIARSLHVTPTPAHKLSLSWDIAGGRYRIRTCEAFATDLQSAPIGRSGNLPPDRLQRRGRQSTNGYHRMKGRI
jgi:hypothetical protein